MSSDATTTTNEVKRNWTIKDFKDHFDFVRFVSNHYGVEQRGANQFISCPFHKETTPSCKISSAGFYCFGCGAHGDSLTFLIDTTGKSIPQIINSPDLLFFLSQEMKIKPEETKTTKSKQYNYPSISLVKGYHKNLLRHGSKKLYLYGRGAGDATITGAMLGYGNPVDFKYFTKPRYTIPVFSATGSLLSIRYRIDPKYDDKSEPKYLGHPNTPGVLYNLKVLKDHKNILYVGSEFDAAILYHEHQISAIAPPGEGVFKKDWIELFRGKNVLIWLDNDTAGMKGAMSVYEAIKDVTTKLEIYAWGASDAGMDTGDFFNSYGIEAVRNVMIDYDVPANS